MNETESTMKVAPKDRLRTLVQANGWSLECAKGYIDGEIHRLQGRMPAKYCLIGIDEYSLGFRAGYFERQQQDMEAGLPGSAMPSN